ncbi:Uncharacterised protein [Mycobacterium tuberculosis]|nr:Uncharacterised protein [Mycobacterium tuberculosis]
MIDMHRRGIYGIRQSCLLPFLLLIRMIKNMQ